MRIEKLEAKPAGEGALRARPSYLVKDDDGVEVALVVYDFGLWTAFRADRTIIDRPYVKLALLGEMLARTFGPSQNVSQNSEIEAVLDENTCPTCEGAHGSRLPTPVHDCTSPLGCRCVARRMHLETV